MINNRVEEIQTAGEAAIEECLRACVKSPPFNSVHEGYAVLLEEVDELWDECKKKAPNKATMRQEAVQIAAMALRFAAELA